MAQLPLIERLGLRATFGLGFYNSSTGYSLIRKVAVTDSTGSPADQLPGGAASMGGVTDATNFSRPVPPTAPSVAWVVVYQS